jgi:penicillin-binding protein 1A
MTELMQAAVETGTAKAAQIGRPLAGKTGTTSSNKDGWFLGFTNELTTGVWMGRDDARAVPGLAGGRAPARAFAAYMARAVGGTPPAPLTTDSAIDPGIIEPDDAVYGLSDPSEAATPDLDAPIDAPQAEPGRIDDQWLDSTLKATPQPQP